MKYIDIDRNFLFQTMPATIKWLEELDSSINDNEIVIRDTDHAYDSLRIESKTYNHNWDKYNVMIGEYIGSHCCICGSTQEVSVREYDSRSSSFMLQVFCGHCLAKQNGIHARIKYNVLHAILRSFFEN